MTPPIAGSKDPRRIIKPAEVRQWLGRSLRPQITAAHVDEIAQRLTNLHWPDDPPSPFPISPSQIKEDADRWWDFRAALDAAKLLQASMPPMMRHWQGLQPAPETHDGLPAILALQSAFTTAMPYIEWPFGQYERHRRQTATPLGDALTAAATRHGFDLRWNGRRT